MWKKCDLENKDWKSIWKNEEVNAKLENLNVCKQVIHQYSPKINRQEKQTGEKSHMYLN